MVALLALAAAGAAAASETCSEPLPEHAYAYRLSKVARQSGVTPSAMSSSSAHSLYSMLVR